MTRSNVFWALGLCAAVAVTSRYTDPDADRALISKAAGDSYSFLAIAAAAPALPHERMAFHHAQRIAIPYVVGVVHHVVPVSLHQVFVIAVLIAEIAILLVIAGVLEALGIPESGVALMLAMLAFNPWAFRHYLTFPEMVNDLGFVLGLAIMLRGLVRGGVSAVVAGQLLASVSRQTGLLLVPLVVMWVWRDARAWGLSSVRRRALVCAAVAVTAVVVYVASGRIAVTFADPSENVEHLLGLATWLGSGFDARALGIVLLRMFASVAIPVACAAGMVRYHRARGPESHRVALLVAGSAWCWLQPFLAGPALTGGNGERLAVLGLIPLVLALAITMREAGALAIVTRSAWFGAAVALLALGSLHHVYTHPALAFMSSRGAFGLLYGGVCAGMFCLMYFRKPARVRPMQEPNGVS
jgi:hypothetical protein